MSVQGRRVSSFRKQFALFTFGLLLLLTGCGGGGGGGSTSDVAGDGTQTSPYILTYPANFAFGDRLSSNGAKFYTVQGLQPNSQYLVTIKSSDPVSFYINSGLCWEDASPAPVLNSGGCIFTASESGSFALTVYFSGDYTTVTPYGSYTIDVELTVGEGTYDAPKDITGLNPYAGTAKIDLYNYYVIHGLTPGHSYTISDDSSYVSEKVYQDQFVNGFCCTFTAASDTVWVRAWDTSNSADYTFNLTLTDNGLPNPSYSAEGAQGAEVELALDVLKSGQTDNTASYYHIGGLTPDKLYGVGIDKISGETVSLQVYNQSGYVTAACSDDVAYWGESVEYDCAASASSTGELWIKVDGSSAYQYLGAAYNIGVYTYYADEGSSYGDKQLVATSVPYTYDGTVDKKSFYTVSGLEPNVTYTATMSGYDSAADISFSMAKAYNWTPGCYSSETAPGIETCSLVSKDADPSYSYFPEGGILSFEVTEYTDFKGTPFTLTIERSAYQSEGTTTSPISLTLGVDLPYSGQIGAANSYYEVSGLVPDQAYTLTTTGLQSGMYFYGYDDIANLGKTSGYQCSGSSSDTTCTLRAKGTSVWMMVKHNNIPASYTIDAVLSPYQAEGAIDSPIDMTYKVARQGMVDFGESYYKISGLTSGQKYVVTATGVSGNTTYMYVYDDVTKLGSTAWGDYVCYKYLYDSTQGYCTITATGSSIWVMMDGDDYGAGTLYTLNSDVAPVKETADLDFNTAFPYGGTTDTTYSLYTILGLQPNQYYTVTLTNLSADLDLSVSAPYNYLNPACTPATGTTDESCGFTTNDTGAMTIQVSGSKSLYGGTFTLGINGGLANEGTSSAPVDIVDIGVAYNGQVGYGASYYRVTGLTPGTFYTVSLANLTDKADLYLYEASGFGTAACESTLAATTAELCGVVADANGYLWVKVEGLSLTGSAFTLSTAVGPQNEGAIGNEVALTYTPGLTYSGSVDTTASYYAVSGLANNATYNIVLTNLTGAVAVRGYLDGGAYSTSSCYATGSVGNTVTCTFTNTVRATTVYVEVSGASSKTGATYTLSMP